ncbi:MAG: hypothetical protein QME64_03985 [bacterium]|nr:hypothetical protein [bacterium]
MAYENVEVITLPLSRRLLLVGAIAGSGGFFSFPFHMLGIGGTFTPLWIPVGIASCLVSPLFAVLTAFMVPLFSYLVMGMPPMNPPIFWLVTAELIVYAYTISLWYNIYKKKVLWSVVLGSVADKLALTLFILSLSLFDRMQPWLNWSSVTKGIPGIVLAIIVVPIIVRWIEKHHPSGLAPA